MLLITLKSKYETEQILIEYLFLSSDCGMHALHLNQQNLLKSKPHKFFEAVVNMLKHK